MDSAKLRTVTEAINLRRLLYGVLVPALAMNTPASAQRVLDLPLRLGAGADALASGPIAVFLNAASIGMPAGQADVLILDVRGPSPTGLDGVGIAGLYRLDERTSVAVGFQHAGIGDILQTTTSPLVEEGAVPFDLSENALSIAAQRLAGTRTAIGASFRYTRASEIVGGDDVIAIGAGFRHAPGFLAAFSPAIAAGTFLDEDGVDWFAGLGMERLAGVDSAWAAGMQYGARGSPRFNGIEHRIGATGSWRERVSGSVGAVVAPGVESRTVEPVGGVDLRLHRYILGIAREQLPNELGAVYQFRFSVSF